MKIVEIHSGNKYDVFGYREGEYYNSVDERKHYLQFLVYIESFGWAWVNSDNYIPEIDYLLKKKNKA